MLTEANKKGADLESSDCLPSESQFQGPMSASVFQLAISEIKRLDYSSYQMLK